MQFKYGSGTEDSLKCPRVADFGAAGQHRDAPREEVHDDSSECANPKHLAIVDQSDSKHYWRYQRRIGIATTFSLVYQFESQLSHKQLNIE